MKILKQTLHNSTRYYYVKLNQKNFSSHRLLALHFIPNPQNYQFIDHINGNRTDNSFINLRWVTNQQNNMNFTKRQSSSSQFKGVSFHNYSKCWRFRIMKNKKEIHLGYFQEEKDAARAYNQKALELFGEYARLNEISDDEE